MKSKNSDEKKKTDSNIADPSKVKDLEQLKDSINKRYENIEREFYNLGLDLIKVNLYVKNFRRWVKDNTQMRNVSHTDVVNQCWSRNVASV